MSFWNEKIKPHLEGHHKLIIALVLLAVLAGAAYYFRLDIKDKVIKAKPQPIQSMELANTNFALQAINSPKLNVQEIDRVSAFLLKMDMSFSLCAILMDRRPKWRPLT